MFSFNKKTAEDRAHEISERSLQAALDEINSKVVYVAMMTDTEIPEEEGNSETTEGEER